MKRDDDGWWTLGPVTWKVEHEVAPSMERVTTIDLTVIRHVSLELRIVRSAKP